MRTMCTRPVTRTPAIAYVVEGASAATPVSSAVTDGVKDAGCLPAYVLPTERPQARPMPAARLRGSPAPNVDASCPSRLRSAA